MEHPAGGGPDSDHFHCGCLCHLLADAARDQKAGYLTSINFPLVTNPELDAGLVPVGLEQPDGPIDPQAPKELRVRNWCKLPHDGAASTVAPLVHLTGPHVHDPLKLRQQLAAL